MKKNFSKFNLYEIIGKAGTITFHHGNIWHGSNINYSKTKTIFKYSYDSIRPQFLEKSKSSTI